RTAVVRRRPQNPAGQAAAVSVSRAETARALSRNDVQNGSRTCFEFGIGPESSYEEDQFKLNPAFRDIGLSGGKGSGLQQQTRFSAPSGCGRTGYPCVLGGTRPAKRPREHRGGAFSQQGAGA